MDEIQEIRKLVLVMMIELIISTIVNLVSFNITILIVQVILLIMNYIFLKKLDNGEPSSLLVGIAEAIVGIVVGNIVGDTIVLIVSGVLAGSIILFLIGAKTGNLESRWFKWISDLVIVVSVFLLVGMVILTKAGVFVNMSNVEKEFAKIEQTDTLKATQEKLGKKR